MFGVTFALVLIFIHISQTFDVKKISYIVFGSLHGLGYTKYVDVYTLCQVLLELKFDYPD